MASQSLRHLTELVGQTRPLLIKVRPPLGYWSWLAGRGPEKQVEKARPRNFQITIDIEGIFASQKGCKNR